MYKERHIVNKNNNFFFSGTFYRRDNSGDFLGPRNVSICQINDQKDHVVSDGQQPVMALPRRSHKHEDTFKRNSNFLNLTKTSLCQILSKIIINAFLNKTYQFFYLKQLIKIYTSLFYEHGHFTLKICGHFFHQSI